MDRNEEAPIGEHLGGDTRGKRGLCGVLLLSMLAVGCAGMKEETAVITHLPSLTSSDQRSSTASLPVAVPPAAAGSPRVSLTLIEEEPAPQPPAPKGAPLLSPDVTEKEKGKTEQEAMAKISLAEQRVTQIDQKRLTKQQQETFLTIQSFVSKAKEALSMKDVARAINLAEKAQTLAGELPNLPDTAQ